MDELEIRFIERFCERFSPETNGKEIVERLTEIEYKFKNLMLGVEGLCSKVKKDFPELLK